MAPLSADPLLLARVASLLEVAESRSAARPTPAVLGSSGVPVLTPALQAVVSMLEFEPVRQALVVCQPSVALLKLTFGFVSAGWTLFLAVLQPPVPKSLLMEPILAHVAAARPYLSQYFGQVLAVSAVDGRSLPFLERLRLPDAAARQLVGGDFVTFLTNARQTVLVPFFAAHRAQTETTVNVPSDPHRFLLHLELVLPALIEAVGFAPGSNSLVSVMFAMRIIMYCAPHVDARTTLALRFQPRSRVLSRRLATPFASRCSRPMLRPCSRLACSCPRARRSSRC